MNHAIRLFFEILLWTLILDLAWEGHPWEFPEHGDALIRYLENIW